MATLIGFLFGFVGSIPVAGPISILVLSRAVEGRLRNGFWIAAGASIAEAAYAFLAYLGFSSFLARHDWIGPTSRVAAAAILIALGIGMFRGRMGHASHRETKSRAGNKRSFLLGLSLTAMNPVLIATWTAAITMLFSLGLLAFEPGEAFPFSVGVCGGIVSWFAVVLLLAKRYRDHFSHKTMARVVKVTGGFVIALGIGFAVRAAMTL